MRQLGPSHRSQPAAPLFNSLVAIVLKYKGMSKKVCLRFILCSHVLSWGVGSDSKLGHGASHGLGWGDVPALIMGTCKARAAV